MLIGFCFGAIWMPNLSSCYFIEQPRSSLGHKYSFKELMIFKDFFISVVRKLLDLWLNRKSKRQWFYNYIVTVTLSKLGWSGLQSWQGVIPKFLYVTCKWYLSYYFFLPKLTFKTKVFADRGHYLLFFPWYFSFCCVTFGWNHRR